MVVFVHGFPETAEIWKPLQAVINRPSIALALPGFGSARPAAFTATKDAYANWLAGVLRDIEPPLDVVGHDIGALLTMRIASAFDLPLRSWAVDVANVFHPRFEWPERVHQLQTPGVGEAMLESMRQANPDDPNSTASRLIGGGVPPPLAHRIGTAHDRVMSRSILDFYRSAVPNVAADWWPDTHGCTEARGLVLLLPDPPEEEAKSIEVADGLGAGTARLDGLNHCWLAEAPKRAAAALERFWDSV